MIKEYFDEIRSGIVNVLSKLQFNGADVLTTTSTEGRSLPIKNVADPVDEQDVVTKKYLQDNGSGGVATVNDKAPDAGGNVIVGMDDVAKKGATSTVAVNVPHSDYTAGWAANPSVPTRGDLYAKIETLATKEEIANIGGQSIPITLNATGTVEDRVNGAVEGTDYPTGWVLAADDKDLVITHNLGLHLESVVVVVVNGTTRQLRSGSAAYSTWYDYDSNEIRIQSLATVNAGIAVYLRFL